MANRFTSPVATRAYDPQAAPRGALADVPRDLSGGPAATMGAISERLANKFGQIADQAAAIEGTRAGTIAGNDPNFRPSNNFTIRARATDRAGIQVYASRLTAKLSSDMADLYDANKDNPAGFATAAQKLRADYEAQHVFPEVLPEFNDRFSNLELAYRTRTRDNFDGVQKDQARAAFLTGLSASETSRARVLAGGGDAAAIANEVNASVADDLSRIDGLVSSGGLTAEAAAKLKLGLQSSAAVSIVTAAAGRLATPAEIDAFRQKTRQDFADGKIAGLSGDDYQQLDAGLERMATAQRTQSKAAVGALEKQFDDFTDRLSRGDTPTQAEWIRLNAEAQSLGYEGQALAMKAERRASIARQVAALPPDQAQAYVDRLTVSARDSGGPGSFSAPPSANIKAVDPRLVDVMKTAAERMGLRVVVTPQGGMNGRRSGTQNHPTGRALDVSIIDKNGKPIPNFQNGPGFRAYEELAQVARKIQLERYPELNDQFRWGGYFSGTWNADTMHFDVTGGGMAGGDWQNGLSAEQRARYADAQSRGIDFAPDVGATGMSADTAGDLEFARKLVETKTKAYSDDMIGAAAGEGLVTQPTTLDAGGPDFAGQLTARIAQADAIASARSREPQYIRPSEKPALLSRLSQGGDAALSALNEIVQGAGNRAPAVLRELGQDAPVMAQAGALLASGGSAVAVRDALEGVRLKKEGGALPAPSVKDQMRIMGEVMSDALATNPDERNRVGQLAAFIYGARAARLNIDDPTSSEGQTLYRQALQEAAGGVFVDGQQLGGFVEYGGGFRGKFAGVVSVPPGLNASQLPDMIDALRPADLATLPVPPVDADGKPVPVTDIQQALPVRYGNAFRFRLEDPQTGDPVWIRGADGRPFTLPAGKLKEIYSLRQAIGDN